MLTEVTFVKNRDKDDLILQGVPVRVMVEEQGSQCIAQENLSSNSEKRLCPFLCANFIQSSLRITSQIGFTLQADLWNALPERYHP